MTGSVVGWLADANRVDVVVGSPTTAIQGRDLNGDGQLDFVVSGGQRVFVLTSQGDDRFEVTWSGAAGENPVDLTIAKLVATLRTHR